MSQPEIDIEKRFIEKSPIEIESHNARGYFIDNVEFILASVLSKKNYQNLYMNLIYIIQEIVTNANKANLKRVYFAEKGLDIQNPEDYKKGIKNFSKIVKSNSQDIEFKLSKYKKYVKLVIEEYADLKFSLSIINNSPLLSQEKKRIREKINNINREHFSEDIIDTTEGAGMGLYLSLKLLEQSGISPQAVRIYSDHKTTTCKITFKYSEVLPPQYSKIAKEVLKEAGDLPRFPEHLNTIIKMIINKDVNINKVANHIEKDPSISADILKFVNSAKFMLNRKIGSIKEGLNYVGLSGLKSLIFSYGAIKAIDTRFGTIPEIWKHCYKTARISTMIAKIMNITDNDDDFFTAGLLHDMGKIVLMNLNKEKAAKIDKVCKMRKIELPVMEEIMMGISHAKIGGEIAKIWGFPDSLTNAIMYHHDPIMASRESASLVYVVYLANIFANTPDIKTLDTLMIEPVVRGFFRIKEKQDLIELAKKACVDECNY